MGRRDPKEYQTTTFMFRMNKDAFERNKKAERNAEREWFGKPSDGPYVECVFEQIERRKS